MKKIILVPLTICLILVILLGISALTLADIVSETDKEAEQYFEKANELLRRMDYEAAIAEYSKVVNLSSKSKIAQDAQYWIGQSQFRAGQFDAAKETFAKLIEAYPTSAIVPVTRLMVERVQQAKKTEVKRRAMSDTADKGFIIDPSTGVKYTKTATFTGKNDVINWHQSSLNLSPNGKFLLHGSLVIPLDGSEPFDLVDMSMCRSAWSPDGKKVAFYSRGPIRMVAVSPETGRPTGPVKKILDGNFVSWSPDSERIVFVRSDKENRGIWILSVRDGTLIKITDAGYGPAWSPDGKTIAYTKRIHRYYSLWLVSAEGGKSKSISDSLKGGVLPIWSPDGKWILYDEGGKLHLFRLADEQVFDIPLPKGVGDFFSWSPDGKKMLFFRSSYGYRYGLKVVSASGGPPLDLGKQLSSSGVIVWSPDSKIITREGWNENGESGLWIIPLSGDDPVLLEMDISVDGSPSLFYMSPNVKKLAFVVKRDDGTEDLFVVPVSLQDARTTGPAIKVFDGWYRECGYDAAASWSPDGNKLAVIHKGDVWIASSNGDKPVQITKTQEMELWPGWSPDGKILFYGFKSRGSPDSNAILQLIPASGGKATTIKILGAGRIPTWSPDSKELVVFSNSLMSIVPIAGGKARQMLDLTDLAMDEAWGRCWSPDGRNIAFIGNRTIKGYSAPIFVIPVEGGKATMLASNDSSWKFWLSWSPDSKWISYDSEGPVKVRPEGTMWEADFEEIVKKSLD